MVRSKFVLLNYILIFAFLFANPVWAAQLKATQLNTQLVVSATQLNVRSGPTVNDSKVATLSKNAVVKAVAVRDGWFQIVLPDNKYGWVHGDYVYTKDTDSKKKLVLTEKAVVTSAVANVRALAANDATVVATLKKADTVVVVSAQDNWLYVRLADGKQGYLSLNNTKVAKMALSSSEKPTPNTGFVKAGESRPETPSRSEDRDESSGGTSPQQPTTPSTTVLSINGNASSADANILKLTATKQNNNLIIRVTTDKPVSFNDNQDDSEITVNIFDALGLVEDNYDLNTENIESLDVERNGNNTTLTINLTEDSTYTSQRVSGKSEFIVTIPLIAGSSNNGASNNGKLAGKVIVLDAGHGGMQSGSSDPGAVGPSKLKERDVVLDIAKRTKALLEDHGATILMTREGDQTQLSLDGRAGIANNNGADIFVAIHANASTSPTLAGTSTYFYAPAGTTLGAQRETRKLLAQSVQDALVDKLKRRNIGILEANFAVLRSTTVPSILVETAFISNPDEEKLLATEVFRQQAAEGIANGLLNYFDR